MANVLNSHTGRAGAALCLFIIADTDAGKPSGTTTGDLCLALDTKAYYYWDGANWQLLGGGGGTAGPTLTTAETVSGGYCVSITSSGLGQVALCNDSTRMPSIGFAATGATSGGSITLWSEGPNTSLNYNFSGYIGKTLWVGTSGLPVAVAPAASGNIQQKIGVAYNHSGSAFRWALETIAIA